MKIPSRCFAIEKAARGQVRLVHRPSRELVQRHNTDFASPADAAAVRAAMISAAPDWDWSDPTFMAEMPSGTFRAVWAAIYAAPQKGTSKQGIACRHC